MTLPRPVAALLRSDFHAFLHKCFVTVSPGDAFIDNWHIEAIIHRLDTVEIGAERRLIINQPPRSLKSIIVSVAWPAWLLGHDPSKRIICVSYSSDLAEDLHRMFRAVIESEWYRKLFPQMRVRKDTGNELVTRQGGFRFATSVGGTLTGRGGDLIVIDDPHKAEDAQSEPQRRRVIDWFSNTLLSRLDDKVHGAVVLVMQRLHEDDLTGRLLMQSDDWDHLSLAAIAPEDEEIELGAGLTYARARGEALQPEREPLDILESLKAEMGSLMFSAQYQQAPVPLEGNLVRREWFLRYDQVPDRKGGAMIVQSWDIASAVGETNDWSVCTTWLVAREDCYLLDVFRDRLEFPDLRRKVIALAQRDNANAVLIEKAGLGLQLYQDIAENRPHGVVRPIAVRPDGSKADRMAAQTAKIEAGHVLLPENASWLDVFLNELLAFPNSRHDDQVDSVSQLLNWVARRRSLQGTVSFQGGEIIYGDTRPGF
ncbi:phage terminase large subunit [Microbaculum sp. FT89]|uniref:phage terminase large subunit n=1 Tax=Microbaculum sp. FT89 TaxID=3447298 RepID=UPI003F53661E